MTSKRNYGASARLPLFLTDFEDFMYVTPAGTVFLVNYEEKIYGLTCHHVIGDKELHRLVITDEKAALKGGKLAPIAGVYYAKPNTTTTEGTDIVDVCVIDFGNELDAQFFYNSAYLLNQTTVATSQLGDRLEVSGVLAEKVDITPPDIQAGYCLLEFLDDGPYAYDPFLRQAKAKYKNVEFADISGISGAPVFNITKNVLCGMSIRGGMTGEDCSMLYVDAFDLLKTVEAIHLGKPNAYYKKWMSVV